MRLGTKLRSMAHKVDLMDWVVEALERLGGRGGVVDVSKEVWALHEDDLRASGDLFFTWQYDLRWAAQNLRNAGRLLPNPGRGAQSRWEIAPGADRASDDHPPPDDPRDDSAPWWPIDH